VRWTDFIAPVLLLLALHIEQSLAAAPAVRRAMDVSLRNTLIILAVLGAGVLLRLAVTLGVTWGLGKMLAAPNACCLGSSAMSGRRPC
jgi:membrane protease YdiL (CAAX protease family)